MFRAAFYGLFAVLFASSAWAGVTAVAEPEPPRALLMGAPVSKPKARECEERRLAGKTRRLAFIVGNNLTKNYKLKNAIADAGLIQSTLVELGYEVTSMFDADRATLLLGLDRFKEHLKTLCEHDIAAFYYAGNGFEISGITYIATPDVEYPADPKTEHEVLSHWVRMTDVLARFAHHTGAKVIMIDTCRHDPLAKQREARLAPPGGLSLRPNTLISYASEPGHEANDVGPNGRNGPYAYFLSEYLKRTAQPLEALALFKEVRTAVSQSTKGTVLEQWPFVDQTMQKHIYLGHVPALPSGRAEVNKSAAVEARRIALVVGNGEYRHPTLPPLANAGNDATSLAAGLRRIGFEVRELHNLGKLAIEAELLDFELRANGADVAMIYYAGHGIERNGSPFIVPIGANLNKDSDIDSEGIAVMPLLEHLRGVRQLGVLILDACRDNPLESLEHIVGDARNQRVKSGLPAFEINVENIIVAYAAQHGTSAYDGEGKNGYFVEALVENLDKPGMEIGMLFRKVRDGVMKRSAVQESKQQPWTYSTLPGDPIYLVPPDRAAGGWRRFFGAR